MDAQLPKYQLWRFPGGDAVSSDTRSAQRPPPLAPPRGQGQRPGAAAGARSSGREEQRLAGAFKNQWLSLRKLLANGGALVCSLAGLRKLIKQGV
jgi:hypothetical protein